VWRIRGLRGEVVLGGGALFRYLAASPWPREVISRKGSSATQRAQIKIGELRCKGEGGREQKNNWGRLELG